MKPEKPSLIEDFYENVGDPLAGFRRRNGGAIVNKKGKDPFAKDPDVVQAQRQQKLEKDIENQLGGY